MPLRRQVLADRARPDAGMAVGPDPLDRLDREQADRPVRPAVDGIVVVGVAVEAVAPDPRLVDGQLRDASGREVDLDHARGRRSVGHGERSPTDSSSALASAL